MAAAEAAGHGERVREGDDEVAVEDVKVGVRDGQVDHGRLVHGHDSARYAAAHARLLHRARLANQDVEDALRDAIAIDVNPRMG